MKETLHVANACQRRSPQLDLCSTRGNPTAHTQMPSLYTALFRLLPEQPLTSHPTAGVREARWTEAGGARCSREIHRPLPELYSSLAIWGQLVFICCPTPRIRWLVAPFRVVWRESKESNVNFQTRTKLWENKLLCKCKILAVFHKIFLVKSQQFDDIVQSVGSVKTVSHTHKTQSYDSFINCPTQKLRPYCQAWVV